MTEKNTTYTDKEAATKNPQSMAETDNKQSELDLSKPTTGERKFSWLKFGVAEVFILGMTAVIAYVARYGKDKYGAIPNYIKQFEEWFGGKLKVDDRKGTAKLITGALASTMVTFHGGNVFAPAMKWFENSKGKMVDYFNKKYGTPEELEAGRIRVEEEPKQTWTDIIKGRLVAFAIVFTSFVGATAAAGKSVIKDNDGNVLLNKEGKAVKEYRFVKFEDWVGTKFASLTKDGERIANMNKLERIGNMNAKTNTSYKYGRILALDVYATTAAIIIWNVISKMSANKRHAQSKSTDTVEEQLPLQEPSASPVLVQNEPLTTHQNTAKKPTSHTQSVLAQRAEADTSLTINA
ncbi:MAG: hypothetical protein ACN2B6_04420 [Rickettsiales bacterium]